MCYTPQARGNSVLWARDPHRMLSRERPEQLQSRVDSVSWRSHEFALHWSSRLHVGTVFFGGLDSSKFLILQSQTNLTGSVVRFFNSGKQSSCQKQSEPTVLVMKDSLTQTSLFNSRSGHGLWLFNLEAPSTETCWPSDSWLQRMCEDCEVCWTGL